ncbi:MAG: substrate-binding domain-containing protein [Tepidisphaeraceae bacterium]
MWRGWILTAAMCAAALTGCKKEETASTTGPSGQKTLLIGIIGKSQSNPVFVAAANGAKDAAKELGAKYGVNVDLEVLTPTDEDATKQAEAIESLSRRGAAGIAISCTEPRTVTPAIDKAVERGAAVTCFDSDAPDSKRFAFYGTNGFQLGQILVKQLAKAMNEQGTIAVLAGNEAAPNLQVRVAGVKDELAKFPKMTLLTGGVFHHVETPEKAAETLQQAQRANPGIQGWVLVGGWPLFTNDALNWKPGAVKVVSCDALPAQLGYIRNGYVDALMAQDCYGWGYKSVQMLLEKIVNNKTPDPAMVTDPLTRVDSNNVDAYAKNWDKWLAK